MLTVLYVSEQLPDIIIELIYNNKSWSHNIHMRCKSDYNGYICDLCSLNHIIFNQPTLHSCKICSHFSQASDSRNIKIIDIPHMYSYMYKSDINLHNKIDDLDIFKSMNSMYLRSYIRTKLTQYDN